MNLDDLMAVWRSQDASPLHGVNETLLRLALRQDEAESQKSRRRSAWIIYVMSAVIVAAMALFALTMLARFYSDDDVITGWDFAIPIVGAAASLFLGADLYVSRRAQALREQRFGESLRDQLARHITQLDYWSTRAVRHTSVLFIVTFVWSMTIYLATVRVNIEANEPFDGWDRIVRKILVYPCLWLAFVWWARRSVRRDVLPRKRRLEALLKELDGQ